MPVYHDLIFSYIFMYYFFHRMIVSFRAQDETAEQNEGYSSFDIEVVK